MKRNGGGYLGLMLLSPLLFALFMRLWWLVILVVVSIVYRRRTRKALKIAEYR